MPRTLATIVVVACVIASASCTASTSSGRLPVIATTALPPPPTSDGTGGQLMPTCGPTTTQVWAEDVSATGRVLWRTGLSTKQDYGLPVQPVSASGIAVFASSASVYRVRLSDGKLLTPVTVTSQAVNAMWVWRSTVTVLSGQASDRPTLVSLDARTGKERWRAFLSRRDLSNGQAITADGGLATIASGGTLVVRSLETGRIRWTAAHAGVSTGQLIPGPVAADGIVAAGGSGKVRGYDPMSGRLRWTTGGMPASPALIVDGGLILVDAVYQGTKTPTSTTALSAVTGRVLWRVNPGTVAYFTSSGPAGLAMGTSSPGRLSLINVRTGHVIWRTGASSDQIISPLITMSDVAYVQSSQNGSLLLDRAASDGHLRWASQPFAGQATPLMQLTGDTAVTSIFSGQDAYLSAVRIATGAAVWRVRLPAPSQGTPLLTASGILVEPATNFACQPPTPAADGQAAQ
jgi:outer membrane protein assembly factor BamB